MRVIFRRADSFLAHVMNSMTVEATSEFPTLNAGPKALLPPNRPESGQKPMPLQAQMHAAATFFVLTEKNISSLSRRLLATYAPS